MLKISDVTLLILFSCGYVLVSINAMEEDCVDFFGNTITHGHMFVPGPSVCSSCVCYHSQALWCKATYCDPPFYCKKFRIGEKCCEFDCLDSPEEIKLEKERLRKRRRFLGIYYGSGMTVNLEVSTLFSSLLAVLIRMRSCA